MIVVNYHDDLNEVQGNPALASMLRAPAAASPFNRLEWWRNLAENCGLLPLIAVASHGSETAVLALALNGRALGAFENWYNFAFAPIVSDGSSRKDLLDAIAESLASRSGRVSLDKLGADDAADLARALRSAGYLVWIEETGINHRLSVGGRTFSEYLSSRPGQLRSTLKRKRAKLDIVLHDTFSDQVHDIFENIYKLSWKPEEGSPEFLRRYASEEGSAGRLRMAIGYAEGLPVAAQMWTVENGTAYIHKLAHRSDANDLSPGSLLTAALMERVIDHDRVQLVDFGTGNDAYKRNWMEEARTLYRVDAIRPFDPRNWPAIACRSLRQLAKQA